MPWPNWMLLELLPLLAHAVEAGKNPTADDLPFLLAEH
jgi:hypothetical protein